MTARGEMGLPDNDIPLTETQMKLMAFVDEEMSNHERLEFQAELARQPVLAAEAARLQELADLTAASRWIEPTDAEMRRFWNRFYNRAEWRAGWILLLAGIAILVIYGLWLLLASGLDWWLKAALVSILVGAGILLANTIRLKMHTSRFDRYRGVIR